MRPRPVARRRLLVRALLALTAAPLLVVATGGPASACSCAGPLDPQGYRDLADVVFTGEVLRREAPSRPRSSTAEATYVVRVERVYKGEAFAVQEVVTVDGGASCGLELPGSGPALLFADRGGVDVLGLEPGPGQLTATLCGGSSVGTAVPAAFGPGGPPRTDAPPTGAGEGLGGAGRAAAVGLAGAVAVTGAVAVRARRRLRA